MTTPIWILIMGVSGSGKSTVGRCLAERLGGDFLEGDDFHTPESIRKMSKGEPLSDRDREPWLDRILKAVNERKGDKPVVVACSALKEAYRYRLAEIPYQLVYLEGTQEEIALRLNSRTGHFMPPHLLSSQFLALEEPDNALVVPISWTVDEIVEFIVHNGAVRIKREDL
jgi:gluconokinase